MPALQDYQIQFGGAELFEALEPLWRELCEHHACVAPVFADWFRTRPFAERMAEIQGHGGGGLLVQLARQQDVPVGFCICSVSPSGPGEIDSIFVSPAHRGAGLGEQFMHTGLDWLYAHGATSIGLAVVAGNDRALQWYARFGFTPRRVQLLHTAPH